MTSVVAAGGQAVISQVADRWTLHLRVSANSPRADDAYRRRTHAVTTVQRVLAALPGAALSGEQVEENDDPHNQQIHAGWSAMASGAVGDIGALREIIARLAGVEDVHLHGPSWGLSARAAQEGHARALEVAAGNAQADAETIARTLGGRIGGMLSATTGQHRGPIRVGYTGMTAQARGFDGEALPSRTLELAVEPERIDVDADITVTFEYIPDN